MRELWEGTMSELSAATCERPAPSDRSDRPIDLVHLARMTLGERSLEREVLQLFERQAMILLARMQAAPVAAVSALAHTLKGSARAIGALRVAHAAEAVENANPADPADLKRALVVLSEATAEARAYVTDLLRAN